MRSDLTEILVLLDRSGSTRSIATDIIGGFNSFLDSQKTLGPSCLLSLVQFDNEYEVVHWRKPITEIPELTSDTFIPRGTTALLDSWGMAMVSLGSDLASMPENERPGHVIFVVITDGLENSSKEYKRAKIFEMVRHQEEVYSWTFLFLAANQDAIHEGRSFGVDGRHSLDFVTSSHGTASAFSSLSRSVSRMRAGRGGDPSSSFSDRDRNDAMKGDPAKDRKGTDSSNG